MLSSAPYSRIEGGEREEKENLRRPPLRKEKEKERKKA